VIREQRLSPATGIPLNWQGKEMATNQRVPRSAVPCLLLAVLQEPLGLGAEPTSRKDLGVLCPRKRYWWFRE